MKIKIIGLPHEGKTAVALLIEKTLRDHGISVENNDRDKHVKFDQPDFQAQRLKLIAQKKLEVAIETWQIRRNKCKSTAI